jgi:maleylpyruvate isomerase
MGGAVGYTETTMKLYGYWRSSSTWRVRIALAWKRIPYTYQPVHMLRGGGEQHGPAYRAVNPLGEVPSLEWTDPGGAVRRLSQSFAIIDHLERVHPQPALAPADPFLAGRARQLAEMVYAGIQPLQNLNVLNRVRDELKGDPQAWARHYIARGLAALEALAPETAGAFLVGDAPTLADVYLVPQLYNARRFALDLGPYPTLLRAEASCQPLPAFAEAHPDKQVDAEP